MTEQEYAFACMVLRERFEKANVGTPESIASDMLRFALRDTRSKEELMRELVRAL